MGGAVLTGFLPAAAQAAQRALPDATATATDVARGITSARAETDMALARIAALNPTIGAVVAQDAERARAIAGQVKPGTSLLAGVPTLVKDLADVRGLPTRRGSRSTPTTAAAYQSPLIDAMEAAGMVILGKSQTPEFGASPTTEPLLGPIVRNPASIGHIAGGSSGGAAAAVASGMVAIAHGTDGGGSLRMPASCCGVFALKPSRGRMIDPGGPKPRLELSVPGALTRSVRDSAAFLSLIERRDTAALLPATGFVQGAGRRRLRIGMNLKTLRGGDPDPEIARVVIAVAARCRALGHEVRPFTWRFDEPALADALGTSMLVAMAEMASVVERQKQVSLTETGLEPLHIRMAEAGRALRPDQAAAAFARFAEVQATYPTAFEHCDLVLSPTLAQLPPLLGLLDNPDRPLDEVLAGYTELSPYTSIQNIAGAPAASLPLGISASGLPIGIQFAGPIGSERTLLELSYELEAAMPWRPGLARGTIALADTPRQVEKAFKEAVGDGRDPVRFGHWLSAMWADKVSVGHRGARPGDGLVDGRMHGVGEIAMYGAMKRGLPDFRQEKVSVQVRGEIIRFHEEIVGTAPDGRVLRAPLDFVFQLKNGRIEQVQNLTDPSVLVPFSDVVKAHRPAA